MIPVGSGSSGRSRYDKCGRLCKVVNGRLTNCCRVRQEFESMTERERERYVRAFHRISTKEPFKKDYDKLIKMHERYFHSRIHQKSEFLPWHRYVNILYVRLCYKQEIQLQTNPKTGSICIFENVQNNLLIQAISTLSRSLCPRLSPSLGIFFLFTFTCLLDKHPLLFCLLTSYNFE